MVKKIDMDEIELSNDEDDDNYDFNDLDEEDIDDELALPSNIASSIQSIEEKKELLQFKRSHSEVEWEEELLKRGESIDRRVDFERLKRMTSSKKSTGPALSTQQPKSQTKKPAAKRGRKPISYDIEEDEEVDKTVTVDEDDIDDPFAKKASKIFDDDDDDLFNSDEEAEFSSLYKKSTSKMIEVDEEADFDDMEADIDADEAVNDELDESELKEGDKKSVKESKKSKIDDLEEGLDDDDDTQKKSRSNKRLKSSRDIKPKKSKKSAVDNEEYIEKDSRSRRLSHASKLKSLDDEEEEGEEYEDDADDDSEVLRSTVEHANKLKNSLTSKRQSNLSNRLSVSTVSTIANFSEPDTSEEATLEDYESLRINRDKIIKYLYEPFFQNAVVGGFLRVAVGSTLDKSKLGCFCSLLSHSLYA